MNLYKLKICRMIIARITSRGLRLSPLMTLTRPLSSQQGLNDPLSVAELCRTGDIAERSLTTQEIIRDIPKKIPIRDLRLLVRQSSINIKKSPALLPRPKSQCYILEIEHIRVLCFPEKVKRFDQIKTEKLFM